MADAPRPKVMVDGELVDMTDEQIAAWQAPLPSAAPRFVPVPLLRQRVEAAGAWDTLAALLMQNPAALLRVLTLEQGVDPTNAEARGMLAAVGLDPDAILAPP